MICAWTHIHGIKRVANLKNRALKLAMHKEARASCRALMVLVVISIGVWGNGCSSLRPPAEDRAVWAYEQERSKPSPQEKNPANLLYPPVSGVRTALTH
jgi:hypothetical protein